MNDVNRAKRRKAAYDDKVDENSEVSSQVWPGFSCASSLASQTLSSPTDIWVDCERGSGTTSTLVLLVMSRIGHDQSDSVFLHT